MRGKRHAGREEMRPGSRRQHQGFTLIEVLIAMTLLSIMVVLLFGSLKICADSWEKGESKIAEVNEVAVVYNFFQRHLSAAKPLWNEYEEEDNKLFSFQGNTRSLQFVGDFPASAGRPGLQLFSIQLLEEDKERLIKVTLTPFFPALEGEQFAPEEVVLVSHVKDFTLAYFGGDIEAEGGGWQNEWLEREMLPQLIKINIELENEIFWPEMTVALKVTGTQAIDNSETEAPETMELGQ